MYKNEFASTALEEEALDINKQYELHVYTEDINEHVEECRAALAASPDSGFVKLQFMTALFRSGQYAAAAELASQVAQDLGAMSAIRAPVNRMELYERSISQPSALGISMRMRPDRFPDKIHSASRWKLTTWAFACMKKSSRLSPNELALICVRDNVAAWRRT